MAKASPVEAVQHAQAALEVINRPCIYTASMPFQLTKGPPGDEISLARGCVSLNVPRTSKWLQAIYYPER